MTAVTEEGIKCQNFQSDSDEEPDVDIIIE